MATDYGGAHGGQPWHGAEPPQPGRPQAGQPRQPSFRPREQPSAYQPREQPAYLPPGGQPPPSGPPFPGPPRWEPPAAGGGGTGRRRPRLLALTLITVGVIGGLACIVGVTSQAMPRKFTAKQAQQITDWQYGKRWRELPAGTIFPASVSYPAPSSLDDNPSLALAAHRAGIAKQATCGTAADPTAAAVLNRDGCSAMLRATYVDETDSFVVTVGAVSLPTSARAQAAAAAIPDNAPGGLGSTVRAVPVTGTPAGHFTGKQRQLSGVVSRGTYVVLYTVGYADARQQQKVADDNPYTFQEMKSAGKGVADGVLASLAAPVPPPHCPGAGIPGC